MLFYPIEYVGIDLYCKKHVPYGLIGWQGVVPTKAPRMRTRAETLGEKTLRFVSHL